MARSQTSPAAVDRPIAQYERLGDIKITKRVRHALWGLNPYCPYYETSGKQLAFILQQHGLRKHHRILDIGCGTGRLAHALVNKKYHGVDVNVHFIKYCQKNLNGKYTTIDVQNLEYNPAGQQSALDYRFDFDDESFDFIAAVQVLNHLRPAETYHYLDEMARMLAPKGTLLLTALLLNDQSIGVLKGRAAHPYMFEIKEDEGWYEYHQRPCYNIAIPEATFRRTCIKLHLTIKEPIRHGRWWSKGGVMGHDLILAQKGGK